MTVDASFGGLWGLAPVHARVLVVDDDQTVRTAMGRLLTQLGHEPTLSRSAEEADTWLTTARYHLLLLDIDMPGMSGLEFLPWALKRDREMPVIMLTGVQDAEVALRCLEGGARNYLVKPPEIAFLKLAVTDALAVRQLLIERNRLARGESAGPSPGNAA